MVPKVTEDLFGISDNLILFNCREWARFKLCCHGDERDMKVSISPTYEAETVTGAVVVMEDITRLREIERTNVKTIIVLEKEILAGSFNIVEVRE